MIKIDLSKKKAGDMIFTIPHGNVKICSIIHKGENIITTTKCKYKTNGLIKNSDVYPSAFNSAKEASLYLKFYNYIDITEKKAKETINSIKKRAENVLIDINNIDNNNVELLKGGKETVDLLRSTSWLKEAIECIIISHSFR